MFSVFLASCSDSFTDVGPEAVVSALLYVLVAAMTAGLGPLDEARGLDLV